MIKLKNISKVYKEATVLDDISLNIQEGECVVLKGVSGSGKSTLLSIIGTLLRVSSGEFEIDGLDVVGLSDYELSHFRGTTLGLITQSFYLFDSLSVRDNIVAALLPRSLDIADLYKRVDNAMALAHISHKADTRADKLSGGEKQRCIIARTFVNEPKIFLCDEPTANLDKENSMKFIEIMKDLKTKGKTIIIATHDPLISDLEFIDRIIEINGGKIE